MSVPARIVGGLPCVACAYSLRGLGTADRCPECGTPVSDSAREHLVMLDEGELLGVRRGASMVVLAGLVPILVYMVTMAAMLAAWQFLLVTPSRAVLDALLVVQVAALLVGPVIGVLGWNRLSRMCDAPAISPVTGRHRREATRLRWLAATFGGIAVIATAVGGLNRTGWLSMQDWLPIAAALVAGLWCIRNAEGMTIMGDIARRASMRRLAASARIWRRVNLLLLGASLSVGVVVYPLTLAASPVSRTRWIELLAAAMTWFTIGGILIALVANIAMALAIGTGLSRVLRVRAAAGGLFIAPLDDRAVNDPNGTPLVEEPDVTIAR